MEEPLELLPAPLETPAYYFDLDAFADRIESTGGALPGIPLTYSIKANPFLLRRLPESLSYVEVCSPGELSICKKALLPGARIIYSGVNKEHEDIKEAMTYGAAIMTAESLKHVALESAIASELGIVQKVILRLTSGNQFGMSEEDIDSILSAPERYPGLDIIGLHYYSGTQKKSRAIRRDFARLRQVLETAREKHGFVPALVEYGPGLPIDYFSEDYMAAEATALDEFAEEAKTFAVDYPLGIEMGRFLAAPCGIYATRAKDIKSSGGVTYVICDGGIHQIKYYGQLMAMQRPPIEVLDKEGTAKRQDYCLCGSLCTVADVLVREINLPELAEGDTLLFKRCGAYSVTENSALFLSRTLPRVYVHSKRLGMLERMRGDIEASVLNWIGSD